MTENKALSRMSFLFSFTDYLAFFAVLSFMTSSGGDAYTGSLGVISKGVGVLLAGISFPFLVRFFSLRRIILLSVSLTLFVFIAMIANLHGSYKFMYVLILYQSFFAQIFISARETYSKSLGSSDDQRSLQAEILLSVFGGQVFGPILGFVVAQYSTPFVGIGLSFLSVLFCLFLLKVLKDNEVYTVTSIFRPFLYLKDSPRLLNIFTIRTIYFWIPASILNVLLFPIVSENFHLSGTHVAFMWTATGIGSTVSSWILKSDQQVFVHFFAPIRRFFECKSDSFIASWAIAILGLVRIPVGFVSSLPVAFFFMVLAGFCLGLNATTTQSIRRKLCDKDQHPEILALEPIVSKTTDVTTGIITKFVFAGFLIPAKIGLAVSALLYLLLGLYMRNEKLKEI